MYKLSIKALYYVTLRNYIKFKALFKISVFPNLLDPVLFLLALGLGLGGFVGEINGMSYVLFVLSGLVVATGMSAASNDATVNAYISMRIEKTYDLLAVTPINLQDVVIGQAIWGGVRSIIFGMLFLGIALAISQTFNLYLLLIPLVLFIVGFLFSLLGLSFTILAPNRDYLNYYQTLVIRPMYMFSDTFFPVSNMPEALQYVAWLSPLYHGVQICRSLMMGNLDGTLASLAWLLIVIVIIFYIPVILINKKLRA